MYERKYNDRKVYIANKMDRIKKTLDTTDSNPIIDYVVNKMDRIKKTLDTTDSNPIKQSIKRYSSLNHIYDGLEFDLKLIEGRMNKENWSEFTKQYQNYQIDSRNVITGLMNIILEYMKRV